MTLAIRRSRHEQIVLTNCETGERIVLLPPTEHEPRTVAIEADKRWRITREAKEVPA